MIYPTIGCALLRHTDLYTDVNVIVSRAYPYPKPSFKKSYNYSFNIKH